MESEIDLTLFVFQGIEVSRKSTRDSSLVLGAYVWSQWLLADCAGMHIVRGKAGLQAAGCRAMNGLLVVR